MESTFTTQRLYEIVTSGEIDTLLQTLTEGIIFTTTIALTIQCCSKRNKKRRTETIEVIIEESPSSRKEKEDKRSKKKTDSKKPTVKKTEGKKEKPKEKNKSPKPKKKSKHEKAEKGESKKKGGDKNDKNLEEEKTVIEKMAKAMGNVFHKKKSGASQMNEKTLSEAKDECISLKKIQILGNLDIITEKRRAQMEKEIESMRSEHEMERIENNEKVAKNKHVIITESKCQLYETNDEPTLDEEVEQEELLLLREEI